MKNELRSFRPMRFRIGSDSAWDWLGLTIVLSVGFVARVWGGAAYPLRNDDSWWHLRHVREVAETGALAPVDPHEFAPEGRERHYPPLYWYALGWSARALNASEAIPLFMAFCSLGSGVAVTLLVFAMGLRLGAPRRAAIIAAAIAALSPPLVDRTALGIAVPHAVADVLGLLGLWLLWVGFGSVARKRRIVLGALSGASFGLAVLTWNGGVYVWFPVLLFSSMTALLEEPNRRPARVEVSLAALVVAIAAAAWWFAPLFLRFGLDPHRPEHTWIFRERTVVLGLRSWQEYLAWGGLSLPLLVLAAVFVSRQRGALFFLLWLVFGVFLSLRSWRGYTATLPLIGSLYASVPIGAAFVRFKAAAASPRYFCLALCAVLSLGWVSQSAARSSSRSESIYTDPSSLAFFRCLARTAPGAVAADGDPWITPGQTLAHFRSIVGLYLQYLPADAADRFRDLSRLYLLETEEEADALCRRYGITVVVARKAFLDVPNFLFGPSSGRRESDYFTRTPSGPRFTERGRRTILFRMIAGEPLSRFRRICEQRGAGRSEPSAVAYELISPPK